MERNKRERWVGIMTVLFGLVAVPANLAAWGPVLGVLTENGLVPLWISLPLIALGFGLIVHSFLGREVEQESVDPCDDLRKRGEDLQREARIPKETEYEIDEFIERVDEWSDEVAAAMLASGGRKPFERWTGVTWYRGRPQPSEPYEADAYFVRPISQRLTMLEDFCRDR